MTTFIVLVVVALIVGLLALVGRRNRRHSGDMSHAEAGHDKGYGYMGWS
jgi:hypothetical protein